MNNIRISRFWIVIAEYLFAVLKKNHCSVAQIVDAICLFRRRLLKENKQNESHKIQNNSEITEPPLPPNINNWLCNGTESIIILQSKDSNIQLCHRNLNIVYYFPKLFLVNILVNVPGHLGTKLKRNNRLGTKQTRNKTNKERSQLGTMPSRNKDR